MNIIFHYPHVIGSPMKSNYNIKWENNIKYFKAWKTGNTGIPIIDAGMRQMNTTGWMHNRVRLIVSNFLVKVLRIDWRYGEKYFAQQLIDYCPAQNNGNWQWSASTGTDSQPYFRFFNPWRQAKLYDKECRYIKKWVSELKDIPCTDIHNWFSKYKNYKTTYPKPIVLNIKKEVQKTMKLFTKALYK